MIKVMQKLFGGVVNEQNYGEFLKELGKRFVPKGEYNARVAELRELKAREDERACTAEELAVAKERAAELDGEVARLEAQAEEAAARHSEEMAHMLRERMVELALVRAGAKNLRAARALLSDEALGEMGEGIEEAAIGELVARLKTAEDTAFLFEREESRGAAEWCGFMPQEAGDLPPEGYAGGFRLRLAEAQSAADCLGAIRVKQEAAARGVII